MKQKKKAIYKRFRNYEVSEEEVGCDDVDKNDKGDRGLYWGVLGCTELYWAILGRTGGPGGPGGQSGKDNQPR